MDSLRDIGYDLPSAVADLVDNSIAADAQHVDITFAFEGSDSWIRVVDDGAGMSGGDLDEAMRYGTERTYEPRELGRFGLGLKTASLSQCRRLTVASRRGSERRRIEIRRWDLDHVARANRWEVLRIDSGDAPAELVTPLLVGPGTVVLWEGLDRVLDYRLPSGAAARNGLAALADEVTTHLAMVFHRFLAGEAHGRRRIVLTMNGSRVDGWDPYARSEPHTRQLATQWVGLKVDGESTRIRVRPYVLPAQDQFSSAAAHARAAGPKRWNRQQGFYFYRNDRLIQGGGWNRLRTLDEHSKLARVAVDVPIGWDEAFRINVAKMQVSIPRAMRDPLMTIATGVASQASTSYRRGPDSGKRRSRADAPPAGPPMTLVQTLTADERDLLAAVLRVARDEFRDEPDVLRRLLSRIERLPTVVSETAATRVGGSLVTGTTVGVPVDR